MITRTMGRSAAIRVTYVREPKYFSPLAVISILAACLALIVAFSFLTGGYEEARGQYMERLGKEKQVVEINKALKMELAAITQKGYLEFAAQERLGLKRPKDEEVVVLR